MRLASLIGAAVLSLAAAHAVADTLNLVCRVHESRPGGAHREIQRRLDIDLARKSVRFYDNVGKGWVFKREGPFVSADAERIRLDASDGKESYVDRRTGQYFFHNQGDGVTMRGPCQKAMAEKPRF
jgi:hypothetical protein